MDIGFRTNKLRKEFSDPRKLQKAYGARRARLIQRRIQELRAAVTLGDLWPPYSGPGRCHELSGDRAGQLSMDLDHPYRLLFAPADDPTPTRPEGGLDWYRVTCICVIGVVDTHD